jgi:hypothetical protein
MMKTIAKELHAPAHKKFPKRSVRVLGIDDVWSMDLVDMSEWKTKNDGMAWMLTIVDVFSRYAWAIPLRDKSAEVVLDGFKSVIDDSGRKPTKIWVDQGKEFYNKKMDAYREKQGIQIYSTHGDHKAMMVERFNRTLKGRMWRLFTEHHTKHWLDMLPGLMADYNAGKHSSIKMSPDEASKKENELGLLRSQYPPPPPPLTTKPKFQLGQWVRISQKKRVFVKGYLPNWTREIFQVISILHTNPRMYGLRDRRGEHIDGSFYEQELQKTIESPSTEALVESVLEERTVKGEKQVLVKWQGYEHSFNQWIKKSDLVKK